MSNPRPSTITCTGAYEAGISFRHKGWDLYEAMDIWEQNEFKFGDIDMPLSDFEVECFEAGWHDGAA